MNRALLIILANFLLAHSSYANFHVSIYNNNPFSIMVKAQKEPRGNLWCDGHKQTAQNPCFVAPFSFKTVEGTTRKGRTDVTYDIYKSPDSPRPLCVYHMIGRAHQLVYGGKPICQSGRAYTHDLVFVTEYAF